MGTIISNYIRVSSIHGRLSVALGLFFGWILSFPMLGPSLMGLTPGQTIDRTSLEVAFAASHGAGLMIFGIFGSRIMRTFGFTERPLMIASCLVPLGLTLCFPVTPSHLWPVLLIGLGIAAAPFVIFWCESFATQVPLWERGQVLSVSMALANLILYIYNLLAAFLDASVMVILSAGCLLAAINVSPHIRPARPSSTQSLNRGNTARNSRAWPLPPSLIFAILTFYCVAGVVYHVIFPTLSTAGNIDRYFGVLPYVLTAPLGGIMADFSGRRPLAYCGFTALGMSMTSFAFMDGMSRYLVTQTLVQTAYAFIDLFLWTTLADIAQAGLARRTYGIGLGLNLFAILGGVLLTGAFAHLNHPYPVATSLMASSILFLAILGLEGIKETLRSPEPQGEPGEAVGSREGELAEKESLVGPETAAEDGQESPASASAAALVQTQAIGAVEAGPKEPQTFESLVSEHLGTLTSYGLTPRELEITELLLKGLSNSDIQDLLVISQGTLKTHLRHIFQKLGVANRKELLLCFAKSIARDVS